MQILVSQNDSRGKKKLQQNITMVYLQLIKMSVQLQCQIMCNDSL